SIGMFSSSKTLRTPTWAMPRANPPPSANPTFGRLPALWPRGRGRLSSRLNADTALSTCVSLLTATFLFSLDAVCTIRVREKLGSQEPQEEHEVSCWIANPASLVVRPSLRCCYDRSVPPKDVSTSMIRLLQPATSVSVSVRSFDWNWARIRVEYLPAGTL